MCISILFLASYRTLQIQTSRMTTVSPITSLKNGICIHRRSRGAHCVRGFLLFSLFTELFVQYNLVLVIRYEITTLYIFLISSKVRLTLQDDRRSNKAKRKHQRNIHLTEYTNIIVVGSTRVLYTVGIFQSAVTVLSDRLCA